MATETQRLASPEPAETPPAANHDTLAGALQAVIQNSPNVQASARMLNQVLANAMATLGNNIECLMMDNGGVFVGDVVLNKPQGKGVLAYSGRDKDGRVEYRGEFINGSRHGLGTMIWADGAMYEGEWRNDKIVGFAEETYSDKSIYRGQFLDECRHGLGEYKTASGLHAGGWDMGLCHGVGFRSKENGTTFWALYDKGVLLEQRSNGNDVKADLAEVIWHTKCVVDATRKLSERLRPLDAIAYFIRQSVGEPERTPTPSPGPTPTPPEEPAPEPDQVAVPEEEQQAEEVLAEPEPERTQDAGTEMEDSEKMELRRKVDVVEMACQTDAPEVSADEGVQTEPPEPEPPRVEQPADDGAKPEEEAAAEVVKEEEEEEAKAAADEQKAAVKLQAGARGMRDRKAVKERRKAQEEEKKQREEAEQKRKEEEEARKKQEEEEARKKQEEEEEARRKEEEEHNKVAETVAEEEMDTQAAPDAQPVAEEVAEPQPDAENERKAAVKLQAGARGYRDRKAAKERRRAMEEERRRAKEEEEAAAAAQLQQAAEVADEVDPSPPDAQQPPEDSIFIEIKPTPPKPKPQPKKQPAPPAAPKPCPPPKPKTPFEAKAKASPEPKPPTDPKPPFVVPAQTGKRLPSPRTAAVAKAAKKEAARKSRRGARGKEGGESDEALHELNLPMRERLPGLSGRPRRHSPRAEDAQTLFGIASPYKTSPRVQQQSLFHTPRRRKHEVRPEWDFGGIAAPAANPVKQSEWRRVPSLPPEYAPYRVGNGISRLDNREHPWLEGSNRPRDLSMSHPSTRETRQRASSEREAVLQLLAAPSSLQSTRGASAPKSDPNSIWDDIQPVQKDTELPFREKGLLKAYFPKHYQTVCGPKPPVL